MKGISVLTASELKYWDCDTETVDGWKPARPIGIDGIFRRFKLAWKVFTGKADVLTWHKQ